MTRLESDKLPVISVVTVVFNGAREIADTIESVLAQDYKEIEFIVIDGGSIDGTLDILKSYSSRICFLLSEPDNGIYDAMNKGLRAAQGEYILFMNCGDSFYDNYSVTNAVKKINRDREQVLFGRWIRKYAGNGRKLCIPNIKNGSFNHQAALYSKSIHSWHGEYLSLKGFTAADYLFFVTLFDSTRVDCIEIDSKLAIIDVDGVSSTLQTVSQKYSLDFSLGRIGRKWLLIVIIIHPFYHKIKNMLGLKS